MHVRPGEQLAHLRAGPTSQLVDSTRAREKVRIAEEAGPAPPGKGTFAEARRTGSKPCQRIHRVAEAADDPPDGRRHRASAGTWAQASPGGIPSWISGSTVFKDSVSSRIFSARAGWISVILHGLVVFLLASISISSAQLENRANRGSWVRVAAPFLWTPPRIPAAIPKPPPVRPSEAPRKQIETLRWQPREQPHAKSAPDPLLVAHAEAPDPSLPPPSVEIPEFKPSPIEPPKPAVKTGLLASAAVMTLPLSRRPEQVRKTGFSELTAIRPGKPRLGDPDSLIDSRII